jgi:hypothetical protein
MFAINDVIYLVQDIIEFKRKIKIKIKIQNRRKAGTTREVHAGAKEKRAPNLD